MIKQHHLLYFILIVASIIALLLYNPWLLYFQNDDMVHIPLSRDGIILQRNSFRPLCDISMILDYKLWGEKAWGYHFTNLLLHIINSVVVFILSKFFIKKYLPVNDVNLTAFTTAVIFWIYMNHSEAVFWILGRSAMLGMLFFLPAIIFYFLRSNKLCFLISIFFCLMAWLSYESTIIIPAVFLLISFVDIKNKISYWKMERKFLIITVVAFLIYCCCRFYFMGLNANYYNINSGNNISFLFIAGSLLRLAIRSWLPPSQNSVLLIIEFIVLFIFIGWLIINIKNKKLNELLLMLFLLWVISLLPYAALSVDTKGVESERFIYLPSLFVSLGISILSSFLISRLKIIYLVFIVAVNILILSKHAIQYRFAGSVVSTTIKAINTFKNIHHLFAINVPQENHGALIFRSGFIEGVNWLKHDGAIDRISVLSQNNTDLPLRKDYRAVLNHNTSLIRNSIDSRLSDNDVYCVFTDSALIVIQKNIVR